MTAPWKPGRGTLGPLDPLLGSWMAKVDSPMGPCECTRTFERFGGKWIKLTAAWRFGSTTYDEIALFGAGEDGLAFWSFTNDGKHSQGKLAEASDVHAWAVAFEAQMPAGLARQVYWPDGEHGFHWAVEARNKKGWRRFTEHHYRPLALEPAP